MKDASRSVPVVSQLLSDEQRPKLLESVRTSDYDALRARHAAKSGERPLVSLAAARAQPHAGGLGGIPSRSPASSPRRRMLNGNRDPTRDHRLVRTWHDYPLAELRDYIDWMPFFNTWEMKGRFPDILHNPASGEAAPGSTRTPQRMLDQLTDEKWLRADGVLGLFPASPSATTSTSTPTRPVSRSCWRRCTRSASRDPTATASPTGRSRFVAPGDSGMRDHVGAFAVTAGLGVAGRSPFKADLDDYSAILLESLADRLAEAFAERMHERVRRDLWGYATASASATRRSSPSGYVGIRPAPGYPACPDHTRRRRCGRCSTSSTTRDPAHRLDGHVARGAVSGWYFSHPRVAVLRRRPARPRPGRSRMRARKGWSMAEAERWLGPNLGYQPED